MPFYCLFGYHGRSQSGDETTDGVAKVAESDEPPTTDQGSIK